MTSPPPPDLVRRWPMLAAAAGGVLAFAAVLAVLLAAFGRSGRDVDTGAASPGPSVSYMTPPAADVRRIHDTLDDIAAYCTPQADGDDLQHLQRDVDVILAFARRYPNAEFSVDDETGHTLSLLLAVRDDLSHCAPAAAARISAVLPEQFRQAPGATASTTSSTDTARYRDTDSWPISRAAGSPSASETPPPPRPGPPG